MNDFRAKRYSLRWLGLLAAVSMEMAAAADQAVPVPSAESLIAQAVRYEHGEGIAKNARRAAELYCAAARQGSAQAAYRLGWMYSNGRGLERDERYAVALYQRAAAQGHDYAKRMLRVIRADDPVLPDCISAPVSALLARAELAAMDQLEQAERAKADAAIAELARAEELVKVETIRAEIARAEQMKAETLAHAERSKLEAARVQLANAQGMSSVGKAPTGAASEQVAGAIASWSDAWSRKDLNAYLGAYAKDFVAEGGRSKRQWERERRARILEKSWIEVRINALQVRLDGSTARARFLQEYRSDQFSEISRKVISLVKVNGDWLIQQEQSAVP